LFTLCSARDSALVQPVGTHREITDLSDFESGRIADARLAGRSVIKTAILLGLLIAKVSKVI
jgi:hypothetical protein